MAFEACPIKTELEKACHSGCHHPWEEYEQCAWRISNYHTLPTEKLISECTRKEMPLSKKGIPFTRDQLVENLIQRGECSGQYIHYWECVDKCVAPQLWAKLQ